MKIILAVTAVVGGAFAAPATTTANAMPTATIASGVVIGTTAQIPSATLVNKYLGIPFAKSPPERFSPPENATKWSKPLEANAFKPACIQQFNYPESSRNLTMEFFNSPGGTSPPQESEDCLYLNVFTPATPSKDPRSVMFWIYGGDLQFGDAGLPFYDGTSFAAHQDVIVVTTNYRTNVFGYSNSPQIATGKQNSGFLDQRKALEWVQQNIHVFGGDPEQVTIFGESAGGYSVKQLLAVPPSPLPYRAAIMESEAATFTGTGLQNWEELVAAVNCTTASSPIDCVRALPAVTIQSVIEHKMLSFAPAYDNVTCVQDVRPVIQSKKFANVPVYMGTNANEGRVFIYIAGIMPNAGQSTIAAYLNSTFPGDTALQQAILAAYPTFLTKDAFEFVSQVFTDLAFTCTTAAVANTLDANGYEVWRYQYNASFPNTQLFPDSGAYHSSEIPLAFGTYPKTNATQREVHLSQVMQTAWANFAKNPSGGPGWNRVGTNNGVWLGDFGGNGTNDETTIQHNDVDYVCTVYGPIIDAEPL